MRWGAARWPVRNAATYSVENIGDRRYHAIRIELK
jgi:hypothetical protein